MVALFSTLLSKASTGGDGEATVSSSSSSSSSIPTLIQLFQTKAIMMDPNVKEAGGHAVLSYQAIEAVLPDSLQADESSLLFGKPRRSKKDFLLDYRPNLGVWNCLVRKTGKKSNPDQTQLADQVLRIPDSSGRYCFTVDLVDSAAVEPTVSSLQETLVRLMIQQPPKQDDTTTYTTSLDKLRHVQFGLAPDAEDKPTPPSEEASNDDQKRVKFSLMICAIVPAPPDLSIVSSGDAYKNTQALALILYHLRKYAATLDATLCFVREGTSNTSNSDENPSASGSGGADGDENGEGSDEQQSCMTYEQLGHVWREWAQGNAVMDDPAIYSPGNQQEDVIDSVLLRNANYPGHWDASKDSLWKALPNKTSKGGEDQQDEDTGKSKSASGDEEWLTKLRDSVVADAPSAATAPSSAGSTSTFGAATEGTTTPAKQKDAAVASSFFENLLKK